jgi:hypothetical protein
LQLARHKRSHKVEPEELVGGEAAEEEVEEEAGEGEHPQAAVGDVVVRSAELEVGGNKLCVGINPYLMCIYFVGNRNARNASGPYSGGGRLRRTVSNYDDDDEEEQTTVNFGGGGGFMGRGNRGGGILSRVGTGGEVTSIAITNLNYDINDDDLNELFGTVSGSMYFSMQIK